MLIFVLQIHRFWGTLIVHQVMLVKSIQVFITIGQSVTAKIVDMYNRTIIVSRYNTHFSLRRKPVVKN